MEVFHSGPEGRVLLMMGFAANLRMLHLLRATDHVFSLRSYDDREPEFETHRNAMAVFGLDRRRVTFLCADEAQARIARASGLVAEVFNHNSMLDERVFRMLPRTKIYDAVSTARLVKYKRVRLARRVGRLAILPGHRIEGGEYDDPREIPHAYLAPGPLPDAQVVEMLARAQVGLALSAREGACFASSEYLLCGLPVVSTPSLGGRDAWYDDDNSLICEPDEDAVAQAVRELVERLARGDIRRDAIRARHVQRAARERRRLVELLGRSLAEMGVRCDVEAQFRDRFRHKYACTASASYEDLCRTLTTPFGNAGELLTALGVSDGHAQLRGAALAAGSEKCTPHQLPAGAAERLVATHPDLARLRRAYAGHPAAQHAQWAPEFVGRTVDLRYFRADGAYLWQKRGLGVDSKYVATAYYTALHDPLGLRARLSEDDLFGAHTVLVDEWRVSRDLLDSITEINLLSRLLAIETRDRLRVLDIGAGYGRLAHRLSAALPNLEAVLCADAVPESTFLCEYYLRFRGVENARAIPLDAIEAAVGERPIDLALDIHAFGECRRGPVAWWLALLRRRRVPHIVVGADECEGPGTLTCIGDPWPRRDLVPLFAEHGYRRTQVVPKYAGSSAQQHCLYPTHYHLFELVG